MPRRVTAAPELVRALETSSRPVYLLDEARTIVFCNAACAVWVGIAAEALVGQTCHYHAPAADNAPASAAARLCPPPEALHGASLDGRIAALAADGQLVFRRADFLPLGESEEPGPLLVIGGETDLAAAAARDGDPARDELCGELPGDLHVELARVRQQFAGRHALDRLVGSSPAATRARAQVQLAAAAPANVLILGPPGAGKEYVAKAIHYRQPAKMLRALAPVACGTLPAELLVSTLEALLAKAAAGKPEGPGTLLLRNVDRLPPDVQPQVLRLLRPAAVPRVISTAERPLDPLVAAGTFSAELAALLSTLTIELVPLAQRSPDLPLLAQMFLEEFNADGGRQMSGFTPEALDQLAAYHWPGNLDELADMVREMRAEAAGVQIGLRDLPKRIHLAAGAALHPRRGEDPIELEQVLERIETELIQRALERAKGNKSRAAELLGLSRPRLYRRLVQLGLEGGEPVEFEEPQ